MSKVVAIRGARSEGWSKDRWAWMEAVVADRHLSRTSRLVAVVMAQGFANHQTGECRPGLPALMAKTGSSRASVMRALSDLQTAGWLARIGGNAPGRSAGYTFRRPEQVATLRREQIAMERPKQVSSVEGTGLIPAISPCTPYKDKPHMNHKASLHPKVAIRGLPPPECATRVIAPGTLDAELWDAWLEAEGFPPLDRIGYQVDGGYRMPVTTAPKDSKSFHFSIARKWADWLKSRV